MRWRVGRFSHTKSNMKVRKSGQTEAMVGILAGILLIQFISKVRDVYKNTMLIRGDTKDPTGLDSSAKHWRTVFKRKN